MRAESAQRESALCSASDQRGAGCTWIPRPYTRAVEVADWVNDCVFKSRRVIPDIIRTNPTQSALGQGDLKKNNKKKYILRPHSAQGLLSVLFGCGGFTRING